MDKDALTSNLVGSIVLSVSDIIESNSDGGHAHWQNIYGAPTSSGAPGADQAAKVLMNENPDTASLWKGRILMHIEAFDI